MAKKVKDNPTPRGYANEEQVESQDWNTLPDPSKAVGHNAQKEDRLENGN